LKKDFLYIRTSTSIPLEIVEKREILTIAEKGGFICCVEGGGIPVIRTAEEELHGAIAVIDKDRASAVLVSQISAKTLMILIDISNAYLNFNANNQEPIGEIALALAMQFPHDIHFIKGVWILRWRQESVLLKKCKGLQLLIILKMQLLQFMGNRGQKLFHNASFFLF